jgi:hypothetical protein
MINWLVPCPFYQVGYVRQFMEEGRDMWVLFDEDGDVVCSTENRSEVFFEAADREIRVMMLN